ncbi:putative MutS protein like protein [Glarea lozoyensis 74030]|uniref:Putative MutS protein like protein n=1 Tax=Glarea lozoyensis (strain ATCC 74030 / MF5533) TaxID=1104152 RepID=H0EDK5_GLAL7|nr:putative MutS protein like protein [Glarea lozoyensis 74030]
MSNPRPSTSNSYSASTNQYGYTISSQVPSTYRPGTSRPSTTRPGTARPGTRRSSRSGSVFGGGDSQQIICAISEGRGITPTVGLAFVNTTTGEAVLSQICDNQFYARTINKLNVFEPTEILIVATAAPPNIMSKMYKIVEENVIGARLVGVDRKYWSETSGLEFIQQLAFPQDLEALKVAIGGNYFATCCFSALIIVPTQPDPRHSEQSINNILMLKNFVETAPKFFEILAGARSELLAEIQKYCNPANLDYTVQLIKDVINDDTYGISGRTPSRYDFSAGE